jgi:hypothetical protein
MPRSRLRLIGIGLLLLFIGLFGYACFSEAQFRERADAPEGTNFGFLPIDLLAGRSKYELRDGGDVVYSIDAGDSATGRIAMARAACGIGVLGAALLLFSLAGAARKDVPAH